jgi:glutamyl-tRNA synthetase
MKSRFAPSPTGYLHIGGARTALFAYLAAKKCGGEFKLRIEDTDLERSTTESINAIFEGMEWLGLKSDGEVIYQTARFDRYNEIIEQLLSEDKAYYCNCSKERLDTLREDLMAKGEKPKYDGKCRDLNLDSGVVRFKNPTSGEVTFNDLVKGAITVANSEIDDLIIKRSDGSPTYNLAVVADDYDTQITTVIRGDDHINNTPRQINLYKALGWGEPDFAHLPMILAGDGARMSKRHGATGVMDYRDDGFLPSAMLNYLVRLGWSHGDKEVFTLSEMIELFDLKNVNKAPAKFDKEKLLWLSSEHLKMSSADEIYPHLKYHLEKQNIVVGENINQVIELLKERSKTLVEMAESCKMFYSEIVSFDEKLAKKQFKNKEILQNLKDKLRVLENWQAENIKEVIKSVCDDLEVGFGKVGQPFRLALSGNGNAGAIDITAELVGKEQTIKRLDLAISLEIV